ncbi:hypothetical protein CRE_08329 [Caenorhabditis remanei]|uniref:Uncharacterized protein n=1 Tax=Caenorhabditis remanei TaxID=31234 RepID=E3MPF9_CAERE|nr:hypothetical protein CRE_08329 [Caenorhabditis remanei]
MNVIEDSEQSLDKSQPYAVHLCQVPHGCWDHNIYGNRSDVRHGVEDKMGSSLVMTAQTFQSSRNGTWLRSTNSSANYTPQTVNNTKDIGMWMIDDVETQEHSAADWNQDDAETTYNSKFSTPATPSSSQNRRPSTSAKRWKVSWSWLKTRRIIVKYIPLKTVKESILSIDQRQAEKKCDVWRSIQRNSIITFGVSSRRGVCRDGLVGVRKLNGKHIHGFFVVWTNKKHYHTNGKAGRYLVDKFSHQHFPLFIEYKSWETRLKMAFDRVTAYNPNLAEIIRANRLRIHLF